MKVIKRILLLNLLISILVLFEGCDEENPKETEGDFSSYVKNEIGKFRKEHKIEGLSFALFNENEIITELCLGNSTHGFPVNNETLFSIQSISKNVTALAAMIAVQDSLIDLDKPISVYLPDFTVNSCFSEHSEDIINIRMMLTHTAGFTHEAPVGNNFDYRKVTFDEHINSIPLTWLKFPPGTNYFYSNLGYDLTTRIIEKQSGMSFSQFIEERIFRPTGMNNTTIDDDEVVANENRTEGIIPFLKSTHKMIPLVGSGAVYTSLNDLVRYTQLHINVGKANGQKLIDKQYLMEMYKIKKGNYGLGSHINKNKGNHYVNHNGGGYGYTSTMMFFPEYKLGVVLLCNGESPTFTVCEAIANHYIEIQRSEKNPSVTHAFDQLNENYFQNASSINQDNVISCEVTTQFKKDWNNYVGTYAPLFPGYDTQWYTNIALWVGYRPVKLEVFEKDGKLMLEGEWFGETNLREFKKGFFFTTDGEVMDFTSEIPSYRNIALEKR